MKPPASVTSDEASPAAIASDVQTHKKAQTNGRKTMLVAGYFLAVVFVWAGAAKIVDPASFARALIRYQLLPSSAINPIAIMLPWTEVLMGLCLAFVPRLRAAASILAAVLLPLFTAALVISLARGLNPDCGCFGVSETGNLSWAIARDIALSTLALWTAWRTTAANGARSSAFTRNPKKPTA